MRERAKEIARRRRRKAKRVKAKLKIAKKAYK
jgi:hypothetical protein